MKHQLKDLMNVLRRPVEIAAISGRWLAIVPIKNLDELFEIIETTTTTFKDVYLPLI